MPFGEAYELQRALYQCGTGQHLLLLEHTPVYTLGVRADLQKGAQDGQDASVAGLRWAALVQASLHSGVHSPVDCHLADSVSCPDPQVYRFHLVAPRALELVLPGYSAALGESAWARVGRQGPEEWAAALVRHRAV